MSIYTCIMQIEQRTKIWSLLLVTINKILCQFFEFTQNLKRSLKTYDYWDYYMYILPAKIEEKLASGVVQSLLPQDVVQQIIEEDFDGVPI